jgi:DNA primase
MAITTAGAATVCRSVPCGTALTLRHLQALSEAVDLNAVGVLVGFDADPAGERAAVRAYQMLCQFTDKIDAVTFLPGQDPAQILADEGRNALARAAHHVHPAAGRSSHRLCELDGWDNWLRFAEGQVNALRATAELIAAMPPSNVVAKSPASPSASPWNTPRSPRPSRTRCPARCTTRRTDDACSERQFDLPVLRTGPEYRLVAAAAMLT